MKFHSTQWTRSLAPASGIIVLCLSLATGAAARYNHLPWESDLPSFQYMNIAPLPGAGSAINADGRAGALGALQINIPVPYTPGWGYVNASVYSGRHPGSVESDNGSGILAIGLGRNPALYVSALQVSRIPSESKAFNTQ